MTFDAHANLAVAAVATPPSPATSGTLVTVAAGQGARFPAVPFNATACPPLVVPDPLNAEIVRVTHIAGDVLTIVRAQESTTAVAIAVGFHLFDSITAKTLTDVEALANSNAAAIASEATTRAAADSTLTTNVATNAAAIASEATTRAAADSTLTTNVATNAAAIASEATTRAAADSTLTTNVATNAAAIASEATTRAAADSTLVPRGSLVYNVKDYGALGNGSTDDTVAIQAAITAAAAGGLVYAPSGIYALAGRLVFTSNLQFAGAGAGATTFLRSAGNTQRPFDLVTNACTDVTFRDFTYSGNRANNATSCGAHMSVLTGSRVEVLRARFTNLLDADTAIQFVDSVDCWVDGCAFDVGGYGVVIGSSSGSSGLSARCKVVNSTFKTHAFNPVFLTGSTASAANPNTIYDHVVDNCTFFDFGDTAVEVGQGNQGSAVSNIVADGNARGQNAVLVRDNRGTTVTNITARNMSTNVIGSGNAVAVSPIYDTIYDCAVSNVTCEGGSYYGIYAKGFIGLAISNVLVADCVKNIYIPAGDRLALTDVITQRSQQWGVLVGDNNGVNNNVTNFVMDNVLAVDNCTDTGQPAGGIAVQGASAHGVITGSMAFDSRAGGSRTQKTGWYVNGSVTDVAIDATCKSFNNTSTDSGLAGAQTLYAVSTGAISLAIQALAGQTGDLQQWRNSSGATLWRVLLSGAHTGSPELNSPAADASAGTTTTASAKLSFDTAYWNGSASVQETAYMRGIHTSAGAGLSAIDISGGVNIVPQNAAARALTLTQPASGSTDLVRMVDGSAVVQLKVDSSMRLVHGKADVESRSAQTLASNGAVTVDASLGNSFDVTLQANATSTTITNPVAGQVLRLTYIQDGTGGRTYVWPATCKFAGGTAPADVTAGKRSTVTFVYDGSNWYEQSRAVVVG